MAELRRINGDVESLRRPSGPRVLLPAEIKLCNTVGITEDEYFYFLSLTEAYNGKRAKEYELVPDIRNEATTIAIISLVIGLASTAVSVLLAPKPRSPQQKTPPSLQTADLIGQSKFAPQVGFDAIQDLATLGSIIPLVFTRRGVRVSSQLLWSQLLSEGTHQQFKGVFLFSSGNIAEKPDFSGYAIGDLLLESYTKAKVALFFRKNGGRLVYPATYYSESGLTPSPTPDVFSVYFDAESQFRTFFSGTRTPSTQTQFGVYSPMPNGMYYRPNYELILKPEDADKKIKRDIDKKQDKIYRGFFPRLAAITSYNGTTLTYRLDGAGIEQVVGDSYEPWGIEDVRSAVDSGRENADDAITAGEQYMAGNALIAAVKVPTQPWSVGYWKDFTFEVVEGDSVDTVSTANLDRADPPYSKTALQRVAIGTVSNSRACTSTEIGIKSTVWRQITGFTNVNSYPGDSVVREYEDKNGSISLGSIQAYIKRFSFFTLQYKKIGASSWTDVTPVPFCIKGQTPQPQYNYIRVNHDLGQYEFRFRPYAGNVIYKKWLNKEVYLLEQGTTLPYEKSGPISFRFSGRKLLLTETEVSNTEWVKGSPPRTAGKVYGFNVSSIGVIPQLDQWRLQETRYDYETDYVRIRTQIDDADTKEYWYWDGNRLEYREVYGKSSYDPEPVTKGDTQYRIGEAKKYRDRVDREDPYEWAIQRYTKFIGPETPTSTQVVNPTGGTGSGLQVRVNVYSNNAKDWTVVNAGSGYTDGDRVYIPTANIYALIKTQDAKFTEESLNSYDAISDHPVYESERSSHFDGPEHEIVYVNEINNTTEGAAYDKLAIAGLQISSSKEWSNFSQLSAYFKKGVVVDRLVTSGQDATNLFPEIAYALLTDGTIGAGNLIGVDQVDRTRMATAARFCESNSFYWDGVVSERQNLREFIFEQAAYCLLDFSILGGRFSLYPSVPFHTSGKINFSGKPEIKALFTDGNIRDLQVSFLSPEERQLFQAVCLWRQEVENGFPETRTYKARFSNGSGGSESDPVETFDMSGFCTTEAHARSFALFALKTRKEVDHGVKFETTPQAAMSLMPGEYFRLVSEVTHTSRFNNGSVSPDGTIVGLDIPDGTISVYFWEPGTTTVQTGSLTISNGKTNQASFYGTVFTVKNDVTTDRVYKVESLTYADDGLVEIAGSHVPLTSSGTLEILNWSPFQFVEEFE